MKHLFFVILMTGGIAPHASSSENARGTRSVALGQIRAMLPKDPWAIVHNPALLALQSELQISALAIPSLFGLKELRTVAVEGSFPLIGGTAGLCLENFGFDAYREWEGTIGFGGVIADDLSAGIALDWKKITIKGYGTADALIVTAGWEVRLADGLHVGFAAENILGESVGVNRERLPQKAAMGIACEPLPYLMIVVEGEKDVRYDLTMKAGVEVLPVDVLALRLGTANNPDIISLGFSLRFSPAEVGYSASSHPRLGWTHQIEVSVGVGR